MSRNKLLPIYWWLVERPEGIKDFVYCFDFRNKERDSSSGLPNTISLITSQIPTLKGSDFVLNGVLRSINTGKISYSNEIWVEPKFSREKVLYYIKPHYTILCGIKVVELDVELENFLSERFYEEVYNDFGNSFNSAESKRLVQDWFNGLYYGE